MQTRIYLPFLFIASLLCISITVTAQATSVQSQKNYEVVRVPIEQVDRTPVVFTQEENGFVLSGILYRPKNRLKNQKLKAIIVDGR